MVTSEAIKAQHPPLDNTTLLRELASIYRERGFDIYTLVVEKSEAWKGDFPLTPEERKGFEEAYRKLHELGQKAAEIWADVAAEGYRKSFEKDPVETTVEPLREAYDAVKELDRIPTREFSPHELGRLEALEGRAWDVLQETFQFTKALEDKGYYLRTGSAEEVIKQQLDKSLRQLDSLLQRLEDGEREIDYDLGEKFREKMADASEKAQAFADRVREPRPNAPSMEPGL